MESTQNNSRQFASKCESNNCSETKNNCNHSALCPPSLTDCSWCTLKGHPGPQGNPGPQGPNAPSGNLLTSTVTPTSANQNITLDLKQDVISVDTSNFSPILTLNNPTTPKYLTIKLLHPYGLPAIINLPNGSSFEISPTIPNVQLYFDGTNWHILNNPGSVTSFFPNLNNVTLL